MCGRWPAFWRWPGGAIAAIFRCNAAICLMTVDNWLVVDQSQMDVLDQSGHRLLTAAFEAMLICAGVKSHPCSSLGHVGGLYLSLKGSWSCPTRNALHQPGSTLGPRS
jgi:hypothetical protein